MAANDRKRAMCNGQYWVFKANGSQLLNALVYRTYESKNFQSNLHNSI